VCVSVIQICVKLHRKLLVDDSLTVTVLLFSGVMPWMYGVDYVSWSSEFVHFLLFTVAPHNISKISAPGPTYSGCHVRF